jgi:sulfur carrier protein
MCPGFRVKYNIYWLNRSKKIPRIGCFIENKEFFLKIFLNGKPKQLAERCSVQDLLTEMAIVGQRLAVEVNEEIVSKSCHADYLFSEGDKVEIVHAIGGG